MNDSQRPNNDSDSAPDMFPMTRSRPAAVARRYARPPEPTADTSLPICPRCHSALSKTELRHGLCESCGGSFDHPTHPSPDPAPMVRPAQPPVQRVPDWTRGWPHPAFPAAYSDAHSL